MQLESERTSSGEKKRLTPQQTLASHEEAAATSESYGLVKKNSGSQPTP